MNIGIENFPEALNILFSGQNFGTWLRGGETWACCDIVGAVGLAPEAADVAKLVNLNSQHFVEFGSDKETRMNRRNHLGRIDVVDIRWNTQAVHSPRIHKLLKLGQLGLGERYLLDLQADEPF